MELLFFSYITVLAFGILVPHATMAILALFKTWLLTPLLISVMKSQFNVFDAIFWLFLPAPLGVTLIAVFLTLYPVFTLSTNYPLIAITLRNNMLNIFHYGGSYSLSCYFFMFFFQWTPFDCRGWAISGMETPYILRHRLDSSNPDCICNSECFLSGEYHWSVWRCGDSVADPNSTFVLFTQVMRTFLERVWQKNFFFLISPLTGKWLKWLLVFAISIKWCSHTLAGRLFLWHLLPSLLWSQL